MFGIRTFFKASCFLYHHGPNVSTCCVKNTPGNTKYSDSSGNSDNMAMLKMRDGHGIQGDCKGSTLCGVPKLFATMILSVII